MTHHTTSAPLETEKVEFKPAITAGLFLVGMGLCLAAMCIWLLLEAHTEYQALLAEKAAFIVQRNGEGFFYGSFPMFGGMLIIGFTAIWAAIRGQRHPQSHRRIVRIGGSLILIGLITMFLGRYAGWTYWAEAFRGSGYSECEGPFSITKKWSRSVWTQNPALCTDPEVRRMFSSHEYRLPDINAYVKARSESGNS